VLWHLTVGLGQGLAIAVGLMLAITLLDKLQTSIGWLLKVYAGERLVLSFRARIFQHVQRLSLVYHDARGTADSIYRIEYDGEVIRTIAMGFMPYVSWFTDRHADRHDAHHWQLALVTLAGAPIATIMIRRSDTIRRYGTRSSSSTAARLRSTKRWRRRAWSRRSDGKIVKTPASWSTAGPPPTARRRRPRRSQPDAAVGIVFTLISGCVAVRRAARSAGTHDAWRARLHGLHRPAVWSVDKLSRVTADLQSSFASAMRAHRPGSRS
jgi:ABC-type multidrug transport system fused ATPase/permease subunit